MPGPSLLGGNLTQHFGAVYACEAGNGFETELGCWEICNDYTFGFRYGYEGILIFPCEVRGFCMPCGDREDDSPELKDSNRRPLAAGVFTILEKEVVLSFYMLMRIFCGLDLIVNDSRVTTRLFSCSTIGGNWDRFNNGFPFFTI